MTKALAEDKFKRGENKKQESLLSFIINQYSQQTKSYLGNHYRIKNLVLVSLLLVNIALKNLFCRPDIIKLRAEINSVHLRIYNFS